MLRCYFNTGGCSNIMLPVFLASQIDLTLTLRYYVALNDKLDVTLCECVTVGAEIVLT